MPMSKVFPVLFHILFLLSVSFLSHESVSLTWLSLCLRLLMRCWTPRRITRHQGERPMWRKSCTSSNFMAINYTYAKYKVKPALIDQTNIRDDLSWKTRSHTGFFTTQRLQGQDNYLITWHAQGARKFVVPNALLGMNTAGCIFTSSDHDWVIYTWYTGRNKPCSHCLAEDILLQYTLDILPFESTFCTCTPDTHGKPSEAKHKPHPTQLTSFHITN